MVFISVLDLLFIPTLPSGPSGRPRLRTSAIVSGSDSVGIHKAPKTYEELDDGILISFPEAIYLHRRVILGLHNAKYVDIGKFCCAIGLLAGPYRDMVAQRTPKMAPDTWELLRAPILSALIFLLGQDE